MVKREINLEKLVLDNYTPEEVLNFCIERLYLHVDTDLLGESKIYWDILVALNHKLNGGKSTKVL